jgi:hypothetical protein
VIVVAVRWYLRFNLSYRDVEELLVEHGVEVDHVTVYRWVQRFTPLLADAAQFARHSPGDRWHVDETYVKVNGVWRYVYRAVDQYGQVIDVLVSTRRDADGHCCIKRSSRSLAAKLLVRSNSAAQLGLEDRDKSDPIVSAELRLMAVLPPVFSIVAENLRRQDRAMA